MRVSRAACAAAREASRRRAAFVYGLPTAARPAHVVATSASALLHAAAIGALVCFTPMRTAPHVADERAPIVEILSLSRIELEEIAPAPPVPLPEIQPPVFEPPPVELFDPSSTLAAIAVPRPGNEERQTESEISEIEEPVVQSHPESTADDYWTTVHARIAARLRYPSGGGAPMWSGVIGLDLALDEAGAPLSIVLSENAPSPFAESIRRAVIAAAPFGPPPPGAPRRARIPIRFARHVPGLGNRNGGSPACTFLLRAPRGRV